MSYTENKKISGLDSATYKTTLLIPVIDGTDTKKIEACKLGNALVEFTTNNNTWSTAYSALAIAMRISTDGGTTYKYIHFAKGGSWTVFSDQETPASVPYSKPVYDATTGTWSWTDELQNWYDVNDGLKDKIGFKFHDDDYKISNFAIFK